MSNLISLHGIKTLFGFGDDKEMRIIDMTSICSKKPAEKHYCRERVVGVARDLESQLSKKNITDTATRAVFIRGFNKDINITEEFVELIQMIDTTTADDAYQCLDESLDRYCVEWKQAMSLVTN
ncbi:General transcription factor II-I repeat domain-containing protein 2A [Thelohanellus kitauei]|uniref:General transcription factor II-I repeat domain-containing protein 2A n=1 Tax=Thelohanellus kitauei TaxID=669202 RepID=A0A0C2MFF4_THEKT|nr:General transcription factor II-I repeat domain-containing protein 2A [Thelohanellus kitauei]